MSASGPTANQIKAQLKTLLTPIIGTSGTFKTLILDFLAVPPVDGEDPAKLRSPLDTATTEGGEDINRVNCLMIVEDGFTQAPPQKDATRWETQPRGKNIITRRFILITVFQVGKVALNDPNTAPSDNVHSDINEAIRTELNAQPKLGFALVGTGGIAGPGARIEGHDGLQNPNPYEVYFAGTAAHVSPMSLTVRVIESLG